METINPDGTNPFSNVNLNDPTSLESSRNKYLWKKAKNRAAFKIHLRTYLIVNSALWLFYLFMNLQTDNYLHPWPIWSMLGWGIGLVSHYFSAYSNLNEQSMAEREYIKLLKERNELN
ncbi:hypothetical protein GCM10027275_50820 [Rhabdobacter roseus]|uniref:2TM domain-containing protein n=1 Tax=Rhabdobacter roseus TaxID=1655419 RepID=A0A840TW52_9BACT|nr:2TM domain-containing protein [Rhabdobacter roseus]MBB5287155.1 hypothetical protein [Rhabdobacter roseus]